MAEQLLARSVVPPGSEQRLAPVSIQCACVVASPDEQTMIVCGGDAHAACDASCSIRSLRNSAMGKASPASMVLGERKDLEGASAKAACLPAITTKHRIKLLSMPAKQSLSRADKLPEHRLSADPFRVDVIERIASVAKMDPLMRRCLSRLSTFLWSIHEQHGPKSSWRHSIQQPCADDSSREIGLDSHHYDSFPAGDASRSPEGSRGTGAQCALHRVILIFRARLRRPSSMTARTTA